MRPCSQKNIEVKTMLSAELEQAKVMLATQRRQYASLPVCGERKVINGVDCILHLSPEKAGPVPLFLEIHGGAWVGGDAALIDSFCKTVSDAVPCVAVNINYTKLDVKPFPNPMEEVLKVIDYFSENCDEYRIDKGKTVLCGQSAGAHIAAGSAILLNDKYAREVSETFLMYPFLDCTGQLPNPMLNDENTKSHIQEIHKLFFGSEDASKSYLSPAVADIETLNGLNNTTIVTCGIDTLEPHGKTLYKKLKDNNKNTELWHYPDARHGFLEVNREDYIHDSDAKSDEQAEFARDCEIRIIEKLREI